MSERYRLAYLYNWTERRFITLERKTFQIGRKEGDWIIGDDPALSRKHCVFEVNQRGGFLTDLGSQNGTWLNGTRVPANRQLELHEGDWVQVGRAKLHFTWTQALPDVTRTAYIPTPDYPEPEVEESKTLADFPLKSASDGLSAGSKSSKGVKSSKKSD